MLVENLVEELANEELRQFESNKVHSTNDQVDLKGQSNINITLNYYIYV